MRNDGEVSYYFCQHWQEWQEPNSTNSGEWVKSSLSDWLFDSLTYEEAKGEVGRRYSNLLRPQSASSDLWQKYGIHGFVNFRDAANMLDALRKRNPDHKFRIVRREIKQKTEVVAE
jgi:hypothetical protein